MSKMSTWVQLQICPNLGGCWYPTATAVCQTGSTIVHQQPPHPSSAPPSPTTAIATATAAPSAAATATLFVIHALPTQEFSGQSQPGAFGWFDPEDDGPGGENWQKQDKEAQELEFKDSPEILEALRQTFLKPEAQASAELEASQCEGLRVSPPSPATTAPASNLPMLAATPSGWGVKNAARAVVNGLGNSKASTMLTCIGNDNGCYNFVSSGWTKKVQ